MKTNFSGPVQAWLDEHGYDIDNMSLEELEEFKGIVKEQIDKDVLLDLSIKLLGNGAYGASSHPSFYFYNIGLASDITAECRETTRYMEHALQDFFHNEWWDRKDLHEKFGIVVDQSKKEWYQTRSFPVYGDTDSCDANTIVYLGDGRKITISECFDNNMKYGIESTTTGHELVRTSDTILNWSSKRGLYPGKVDYIIRHKVNKPKWKLKTKSGKEIIVTNDHSMIVFRNGVQCEVKPGEILPTDKILVINEN